MAKTAADRRGVFYWLRWQLGKTDAQVNAMRQCLSGLEKMCFKSALFLRTYGAGAGGARRAAGGRP